jgi:hypothetical protein
MVVETVTKRTCPWCGGPNLHITNVTSNDTISWEDRECGYREQTCGSEYYDYENHKMIQRDEPYKIKTFHKPRAPLPEYQQPEYLRKCVPVVVPEGQKTLGEMT